MNRRTFIQIALAGLAFSCVSHRPRRVSPNGKLNHACIGVGNMGKVDLDNLRNHPRLQVVAVCDVDRNSLDAAAEVVPGARKYADWRELLSGEGDRIDSVNVSTPDHMHGAIAMAAIRLGKHVYCQKPLAHNVTECRAMRRAAEKHGVVTQLGTHYASNSGDRMTVALLQKGIIGPIQRVVLCANYWTELDMLKRRRSVGTAPPPSHLNWDLWTGVAPSRDYAPEVYHPGNWRYWQDFGSGWLGDMGCHIFDSTWKGLGLTASKSVRAEVQDDWLDSNSRRAETWPQSVHVTWTFPGGPATDWQDLTVEWFDGLRLPPEEVREIVYREGIETYPSQGALWVGTDGALLMPHGCGPILLPESKFKGVDRSVPAGPNHYHRFVNACLGGEPTNSSFNQTGPMTETVALGTVAVRTPRKKLNWDPDKMRITNDSEANSLLRRTYREGWKVPGI